MIGALLTSRTRRRWASVAVVLTPVVVAAGIVSSLGAASVRSGSMEPALEDGDLVVFDRLLAPARGDVIVFDDRAGWSPQGPHLIKRVIGVGGDVVSCCEAGSGRLLRNGTPLDEPYAPAVSPGGSVRFRVSVPEGALWVMGDNRAASRDSREGLGTASGGFVDQDAVLGVVRTGG